jgi:Ribosomal protein L44.
MGRASKLRIRLRGLLGSGNNGKYSRPAGGKMHKKKQSKRTDFRFQCGVCKKMKTQGRGVRSKKIELK